MKKIIILSLILVLGSNILLSQDGDKDLPFAMGEKLIFKAYYGVVYAGTYTMMINKGETLNGNQIYKIVSIAKTNTVFDLIYKVRDRIESYWDAEKFFSRRFIKRLSEGGWHQYRLQYFFEVDTTAFDVEYKKGVPKRKRFDALPEPQDELSVFYYLRLKDFVVGDTLVTNIIAGGENYKTRTTVLGIEKTDTIFGKINCIKLKPLLGFIRKDNVNMFVWFTDDKYKIPVKIQVGLKYGNFTFKLSETQNLKGDYNTE